MDVNRAGGTPGEETLDTTLRPKKWSEYVGQENVKMNIGVILDAAKKRGESPEHLLFYGTSGLGKTSLAHVVANEINSALYVTSGPALEKAGDLAAVLTNMDEGAILFIDEIHRLNKIVEEYLYAAMEEFKLRLIVGRGPMARTMSLDLPKFTLIGATTRPALLSNPLRNRFGAIFQLNFYLQEDIEKIIRQSAGVLDIKIDADAIRAIAKRSRCTPRVANRLLKRARDFAQVEGVDIITEKSCLSTFEALGIDEKGLDPSDRKLLEILITKLNGGPTGIQSLAAATSEEAETILNVYEPHLMQSGLIERTPRGRVATKLAYLHLGIKYKDGPRLL